MQNLFMIFFIICFVLSFIEVLVYYSLSEHWRRMATMKILEIQRLENIIQKQSKIIETMENKIEHTESLLSLWKQGDNPKKINNKSSLYFGGPN